CVLKGRANYLCPRRFESFRDRQMESAEEVRVLGKVLVWLNEGGQGDRSEINLNGPGEREVWLRLSAEDEGCKAEVCLSRTGGACPFYQSRLQAQSAHLIIVNHALLLADIATGSRVLPDYKYLIIDEAHHMEAATTNALSVRVTQMDLLRLIREIGGSGSGVLGRVLASLQPVSRPSDLAAFRMLVERSTDLLFRLNDELKIFFKSINDFMIDERNGDPIGGYGQTVRILPATRKQPRWSEVEIDWDAAETTFKQLLSTLGKGIEMLPEVAGEMSDDLEDATSALASISRRLAEYNDNLHAAIIGPPEQLIYWIEASQNNALSINIAPLHIGPLMEKHLWHEKECIILTSATLTAEGTFDYLRERLFANDANELALGSPFDYENAAMLYLVNDIPEPGDQHNYQRAVEHALVQVSKATGGRLLALFTSYAQLKRTAAAIQPKLTEAGIYIYEQGEGASPHALLESFRESDKAVLLGTRSFWEGVDVPGEALSVLMIVKLPFDVPNDPIVASRAETFEDPFNQFSLPEAILRFRQGFGRLIRTQSDRGVVIVLDRRLLSKRYGRLFIDSLPECTRAVGPLAEAAKRTASWLNL
ncbi:MAG: DNA polymerase III subunit epsilon, partial [Anaerolineae bacterium]|nr:DNA polymerase III subunit epsilon [Anaerolineae bacterium]